MDTVNLSSERKLFNFFDTETTGRTDFRAAYDAPHQPNLVQLGYKLYNPKNREVMFEIGHLVNTTGFKEWNGIEPEAQNVHGISEDMIREYGWSPQQTMDLFLFWARQTGLWIAHNKSFDIMILQCFAKRAGYSPDIFTAQSFCTMHSTTNICKIPSPNGRGFKWPKLNEAYPFFLKGKQFDGAHNALVDVNACAEIFWKLVDAQLVPILDINVHLKDEANVNG